MEMARRIYGFVSPHLGLLVTAGFFGAVAIRVAAVARGDLQAASILIATNPVQILMSVLLTILPFILIGVVAVSLTLFPAVKTKEFRPVLLLLAILFMLMVGHILTAREVLLGLVFLLGVTAADVVERIRRRRQPKLASAWAGTSSHRLAWLTVGILSFPAVALVWTLLTAPLWLPSERVTLQGGSAVIGYVVEQGDWVTLITDHERKILKLRPDDIKQRTVCRIGGDGYYGRPLLGSRNRPEYPSCWKAP